MSEVYSNINLVYLKIESGEFADCVVLSEEAIWSDRFNVDECIVVRKNTDKMFSYAKYNKIIVAHNIICYNLFYILRSKLLSGNAMPNLNCREITLQDYLKTVQHVDVVGGLDADSAVKAIVASLSYIDLTDLLIVSGVEANFTDREIDQLIARRIAVDGSIDSLAEEVSKVPSKCDTVDGGICMHFYYSVLAYLQSKAIEYAHNYSEEELATVFEKRATLCKYSDAINDNGKASSSYRMLMGLCYYVTNVTFRVESADMAMWWINTYVKENKSVV